MENISSWPVPRQTKYRTKILSNSWDRGHFWKAKCLLITIHQLTLNHTRLYSTSHIRYIVKKILYNTCVTRHYHVIIERLRITLLQKAKIASDFVFFSSNPHVNSREKHKSSHTVNKQRLKFNFLPLVICLNVILHLSTGHFYRGKRPFIVQWVPWG